MMLLCVVAEPFIQWVVEDRFCAGRPNWETVSVQMTDDVHQTRDDENSVTQCQSLTN